MVGDQALKLCAADHLRNGTIEARAYCLCDSSQTEDHAMMRRLVVIAAAAAGICVAMPAGAEEIGVGVGPSGVTVGTSHGDRYRDRDREVIRERDHRDRDTVVIRKSRDHDRDYDRDRKTVIIDR
jgi:hypothetical protein